MKKRQQNNQLNLISQNNGTFSKNSVKDGIRSTSQKVSDSKSNLMNRSGPNKHISNMVNT